jgi:NAD(P)-dependent dehydrogenase (short-subunit alcohol dehydrogenase family)
MSGILEGRTALVTGASSGMGAETAIALGREGARVIAVGRDEDRLIATQDAAREQGVELDTLRSDLTADGAAAAVRDVVADRFGSLDVLVNAAGVFEPMPFIDTPMESFDRQWRINVRVPFELTQALVPLLGSNSSVILFSSICGHTGYPNSAAYCGTKGAVELITQSLAIELGPQGIRVNCVAPGWIATRMNDHLLADSAFEREQVESTPLGRIGEPADVAPTIVHLASDGSKFTTGASFHIDGGYPASPPLRADED